MNRIGVDIGGTSLRAAVVDENGKITDRTETVNRKDLTPTENLKPLADFINAHKENAAGIGIGCPGPLDPFDGRILNAPNLPGWENFKVTDYFEDQTGLHTELTNDANAAGLAEALAGAGKGQDSVYFLTVSTGVGGAFVYKGEIVNGANGLAAEVHNMFVNEDTYTHRGMNPGGLELQSSGTAIGRIATEDYGRPVDAREVFDLYREGDETAVRIVNDAARNLARGIENIVCVVDPAMFIIGGSVALKNPEFLDLVREYAKQYIFFPDRLDIETARFGGDAGLTGAAMLINPDVKA